MAKKWTMLIIVFSMQTMPCLAQLPPTNMSKYVHTPGDNQYTSQGQAQRHNVAHGVYYKPVVSAQLPPTPAPIRPDISLNPIAAEEPILPSGFPPLPISLDLPVNSSASWANSNYSATSASNGTASSAPIEPTFHQHYAHVPPGAYLNNEDKGEHSYYKVGTPGSDLYATNCRPALPRYTGATARDIQALGPEPRLSNSGPASTAANEVPQPVVVNQSTTQDLSLPEDEFSYRAQTQRYPWRRNMLVRGILYPALYMGSYAGLSGLMYRR